MGSVQAVQALEDAGIDPKVAKVMVMEMEKMVEASVATKADVSDVKIRLNDMRIDLIRWMVGLWLAQLAGIVYAMIKVTGR